MKNNANAAPKASGKSLPESVSDPKQRIRKTFEPRQKADPSPLAEIAFHPAFWADAPNNPTRRENVVHFLRNDSAVRLQVPGFKYVLAKTVETNKHRNGNWLLCALYAINRQDEEIGGAYLVDPEEIEKGHLTLLRNSDRYAVRKFTVHFPAIKSKEVASKDIDFGSVLSKDIESLAFLDTPIEPILKKEIKSLAFLDKKVF